MKDTDADGGLRKTPPAKYRRLIGAGISCSFWLVGILFLHWDINEAHYLFMLDMQLFIFFTLMRMLFSKQNDESFLTNLPGRASMGILVFMFGSGLIFVFTQISPFDQHTITYFFNSPNSIIYAGMILHYFGIFGYDFLYSGKYKTSNPYNEGIVDFISVLVMGMVLSFVLNFSPKDKGPIFLIYNAVGLVSARFIVEIFLAINGRSFLERKRER